MPVRKISEHSLQIRRFNLVNCYLVTEGDGITIVDTAMAAGALIGEAVKHLGQPVKRILLTHAHMDHVGSLDQLKKMYPAAQVICGAREFRIMEETAKGVKPGEMTLLPGEAQTPVKGAFPKVKNLPDTLVKEGDRVCSLEVVNTAGHTPGHLSFLDSRDGILYAGDALVTFGGIWLPFDTPWFFPLPRAATWHFQTALESGKRLLTGELGRAIRRVLPGHGPAVEDAMPGMKAAVERGARKLGIPA